MDSNTEQTKTEKRVKPAFSRNLTFRGTQEKLKAFLEQEGFSTFDYRYFNNSSASRVK